MQNITLQTSDSGLTANEKLGRLSFAASNESSGSDSILVAASVYAMAESEFTVSSNATSIVFATASSEEAVDKLKITSGGHFIPVTNNVYDIGSSTNNFRNVYATSGIFDIVSFDTNIEPDLLKGQMSWNDTEGTVNIALTDTVDIHIGEHSFFRVRNETGGVLYKGQVVYASGVHANGIILPDLYAADGTIREVRFMGFMLENLNNNNNGYAIQFGHIKEIDTRGSVASNIAVGDETWAAGDILYVHPTVPGKLTNVEPKHAIIAAIILDAANNGSIFVRPISYGHLSDNHDVDVEGLVNNNFLVWNSDTEYWHPSSGLTYDDSSIYIDGNLFVNGSGIIADIAIVDNTISSLSGDLLLFPECSGYVGVNTNDPNSMLHVYSSTSGDNVFNVEGTNGSLFSVVDNLSGTLMSVNTIAGLPVFQVNSDYSIVGGRFNQNDFVVTTSGDVGMGTASPSQKLDIRYPTGGGMALLKSTDTNDGLLFGDMAYSINNTYQGMKHVAMTGNQDYMIMSDGANTFISAAVGHSTIIGAGGNNLNSQIQLKSTEVVVNENSSNLDFRVESNNNANMLFVDGVTDRVGIGTGSPGAPLEVKVNRTSSTNASVLILSDNVTGAQTNGVYKAIRSLSNNGASRSEIRFLETDGTNNNTSIAFATAPSAASLDERMRISNNGNVGIGITSPTSKLHVAGDSNITGNVIVGGNLTILGTTVTADVDRMEVEDPIITLGLASGNVVTDTNLDRGLALTRSAGLTAFMGWDTSESEFSLLSSGVAQNSSGNYIPGTYGNLHIGGLIATTANFSSTIDAANLGAGVDNSVVILDSDGKLRTDEIDSRVWGTSLVDGGGVDGHVAFWTDNNTLSYDNNQLFWDSTNNRLGVGTASPSKSLHIVKSTIDDIDSFIRLENNGRSVAIDFSAGTGGTVHTSQIVFDWWGNSYGGSSHGMNYKSARPGFAHHWFRDDNNAVQMCILDNGNVGIGTTIPSSPLSIYNASLAGDYLTIRRGVGGFDFNLAAGGNIINSVGKTCIFGTTDANVLRLKTADIARVHITSDGLVGINNTNPTTALDVTGVITATGGNSTEWNEAYDWIQNSGLDGTGSASGVAFWTDSNTLSNDSALIWDSTNDRLGIGTATPSYPLDVSGDIGFAGNWIDTRSPNTSFIISGTTTNRNLGISTTSEGPRLNGSSSAADFGLHLSTNSNPYQVFLKNDGNVGIGTASPSDKLSILAPANSLVFGAKDTARNNYIFQLLADDSAGNGELRLYSNSATGTHTKQVEIASQGSSYFNGGNVGIGITAPSGTLHVVGDAYVDNLKLDGNTLSTTDTNGALILNPNGTGALQADGGGNARGAYAVDLQRDRSVATQVASGACSVVVGGRGNVASNIFTVAVGGRFSSASANYAAVVGGNTNVAGGAGSFVGGGITNNASGSRSVVSGGQSNCASGNYSTVGGGAYNTSSGYFSAIGGGCCNIANAILSTISGGVGNCATSPYSVIGGGLDNTTSGSYLATIGGGRENTASNKRSTVGGGQGNTSSGDSSTVSGGIFNVANAACSTIGGGRLNCATGNFSTISGGCCNIACGNCSTVGGGCCNIAVCGSSTISGGCFNNTSGDFSSIAGGKQNFVNARHGSINGGHYNVIQSPTNECCSRGVTIGGGVGHNTSGGTLDANTGDLTGTITCCNAGAFSTIGGGLRNFATGAVSTVGGGTNNTASGHCSTIGGGQSNWALGHCSTIGGGYGHLASANSTIGGGQINCATGNTSTIGGGESNFASGDYSTVSGGYGNCATGNTSTIGGGLFNCASAAYSTVSGGSDNTATCFWATVGGGRVNNASDCYSTVSGGRCNTASANYSTVSGGCCNLASEFNSTVSGGRCNTASGVYSTVSGGYKNCATGNCSSISGGCGNHTCGYANTHILGSNICATQADTTYTQNIISAGDVSITGHLSAATKSFFIDHPSQKGKKLQYGSLESPYHGVRLTGKGEIKGGKCVVQLPDYISSLVRDDDNVNVQITNYRHSKTLYVDDISINDNQFTVKCDSWFANNAMFYWTFTAVRKDVQELEVEF